MTQHKPAAAPDAARFEKLGSFIGKGGAMSSMVAPGPNNSERYYVAYTYITSMDLVGYDRATGTAKVWKNDQGGAWAMETDNEGRLYLGTYYQGHLLRLDPRTDTFEDLGQAVAGEEYIWRMSRGPDGLIYGVTYPHCKLFRFDPATAKVTDLGRLDDTQKYGRNVCAAPDGWIYCGIGSEKAGIVAYNARTGERRELLPDAERKPGFGIVSRAADGSACADFLGRHFLLRDGAATPVDALPPLQVRNVYRDNAIAAENSAYKGRQLPMWRVATGPDHKIYASGVLPEYFLRFDPADRSLTTLGLIPGAEAYSLLSAHDKLYIASYTGATLQIFDPKQPFKPGQKRENNPAFYGSTAKNQNRPYDMVLGGDNKVYLACVPGYGIHGGAISWYDPQTDKVDFVPTPLTNHSIASLCALPGTTNKSLLLVGTSTEGGSGAQSLVPEAALFLWDMEKKAVAWQGGAPTPGAQIVRELADGGDGLIYGATENEMFVFDPGRRVVIAHAPLADGAVIRAGLLARGGGQAGVVALTPHGASLVQYTGGQWQTRLFAQTSPETTLNAGKALLDGYVYACADDVLVRCRIPSQGP